MIEPGGISSVLHTIGPIIADIRWTLLVFCIFLMIIYPLTEDIFYSVMISSTIPGFLGFIGMSIFGLITGNYSAPLFAMLWFPSFLVAPIYLVLWKRPAAAFTFNFATSHLCSSILLWTCNSYVAFLILYYAYSLGTHCRDATCFVSPLFAILWFPSFLISIIYFVKLKNIHFVKLRTSNANHHVRPTVPILLSLWLLWISNVLSHLMNGSTI